jgi:hypothetical protein
MARNLIAMVLTAMLPNLAAAAIVLDARSIAVMRIQKAAAGEWKHDTPNERRRVVELDLRVERVFRGPLHAGEKLTIEAAQAEPTGRVQAPAGPWSGKVLVKGSRYLVFSQGPSQTLRVADVAEIPGVELALAFEEHHWALGEIGARAGKRRGLLGPVFAEYLAARLPAAVPQGIAQWNSIMSFIEEPGLTPHFRAGAATAAMDAVLAQSPAPEAIVQRTAVMAFRILGLPDESGFRERLVRTYLPNLLGFEGSEPMRSAERIFASNPGDRERALKALSTVPPSSARSRLDHWIAGK